MVKKIINIVITLIIGALLYYLTLPAINLNNMGFYSYIATLIIVYAVLEAFNRETGIELFKKGKKISPIDYPKTSLICIGLVVTMFIVIGTINFIFSPMFNAKSYQTRIVIDESGNFTEDIEEVNFNQLPLLDRASSEVLGDRVMGQMSELVSQYRVSKQ